MYSEVPLVLFTMFSLIGAGTFIVLAVLIRVSKLEQKILDNIDTLSIMPTLAVVLGLVAALFGIQDQTNAVVLLLGVDGGLAWVATAGMGGLFASIVVFYCLRVNFGKIAEGRRKLLLSVVGALGLLFVCAIGIVHMMAADPSWGTLATPAQMLGFALLGGSAVAALIFEKADALSNYLAKRTLVLFAFVGAVLGVGGFTAQIVMVLNMVDVAGGGVDLIQAVSMQITVGLFCLVAVLVFEVMAIRMKETGFHSVIAVVCAFVGVFCARLVFYVL